MWPFRKREVLSQLSMQIRELMRGNPADWNVPDTYWLIHKPSGMAIWIANEAYGFKLHDTNDVQSNNWAPTRPERDVLWREVEALRERLMARRLTNWKE